MSSSLSTSEAVEVRSPYRPLPRSARKEIADTVNVIEELDGGEMGRNDGVLVDKRPPEELLDRFELEVIREPDIVYESDEHDEGMEIYCDPEKVVFNGRESRMSPAEAVKEAESRPMFTRVTGVPEQIDGVEVADIDTDADPPIDQGEIPDRWEMEHHPRRGDQRMFMLICRPPESETDISSAITLTTPTNSIYDNDRFTVTVSDRNATGPSTGHSNPISERLHHDDLESAVEFTRECAQKYPL